MQAFFRNLPQLVSLVATVVTSEVALAADAQWQLVSAKGQGALAAACRVENIQSTASGGNSSLTLNSLGIDLASAGKKPVAQASGYCDINLAMIIPQNHYLTAIDAQLLGGIIKAKGAMTLIDVAYFFTRLPLSWSPAIPATGPFGQIMNARRVFMPRDHVNEPLFALEAQRNFSRAQQRMMCLWTRKNAVTVGYRTRISIAATRTRLDQASITQVDGIDNNINMATGTTSCP